MSSDARRVAFAIQGEPASMEASFAEGLYLLNVSDSLVSKVPMTHDGKPIDDPIVSTALNGDGNVVAFQTAGLNELERDDVFVTSLREGSTTMVSGTVNAENGNGNATRPILDEDGDLVGFTSTSTNLGVGENPGGRERAYIYDRSSGDLELVSLSPEGHAVQAVLTDLSADGTHAVFGWNHSYIRDLNRHETASVPFDGDSYGEPSIRFAKTTRDERFVLQTARDLATGRVQLVLIDRPTATHYLVLEFHPQMAGVNPCLGQGHVLPYLQPEVFISHEGASAAFATTTCRLHDGDRDAQADVYWVLARDLKPMQTDGPSPGPSVEVPSVATWAGLAATVGAFGLASRRIAAELGSSYHRK